MKHLTLILVLLTLGIAGLAASADAATLSTSPVFSGGPPDNGAGICAITNTSSSEISVTITLFNSDGESVAAAIRTIGPGQVETSGTILPEPDYYYCKFVVPNANRVRANLQIVVTVGSTLQFVRAIVEAK